MGANKSGFIAIIGPPNAGKSTLLNKIVGEKISITSKKPQTTRNQIKGIVNRKLSQLVFIDTPGIFKADTILNNRLVETALSSIKDVDLILVVIDVSRSDNISEEIILSIISKQKNPVFLALNKIDLIEKPVILTLMDKWSKKYSFKAIVPISAYRGEQVETLVNEMENSLKEGGTPFYSSEMFTDMPERFIASEMIREKIFHFTGKELPYATAVTIDHFKEDKSIVNIHAVIHVERDSQKGIIIGANGQMLKKIGEASRKEIERMVGSKVFLKLFVRVQKNWRNDTKALIKFDLLQ